MKNNNKSFKPDQELMDRIDSRIDREIRVQIFKILKKQDIQKSIECTVESYIKHRIGEITGKINK